MEKKMKVKKNVIKSLVLTASIIAVIFACSEVFLISVTVSYPFDENNPEASPSKYEIDINDGLELLDRTLSKQTRNVADKVAGPLKSEIESNIRSEFGDNVEITFDITEPGFITDDFVDLISGKNVEKTVTISTVIEIPQANSVEREYIETLSFNICDFDDNSTFSDSEIRMEIINIADLCKRNGEERKKLLDYCLDKERTTEDLKKSCVYLKATHENKPIVIALSEVKELKNYTKFLSKIYSATLNDLNFSILEAPDFKNNQKASSFILEAELFSQPVARFFPDGSKCTESNEACIHIGINEDGEPENYFSDDPKIKEKYLVGYFGSDSFEDGSSIELLYSYDGKDILQKSIKNLDFQIGAKSFYLFFPQSGRPLGKLSMEIKAKLLFTVEPLN